MTMLVIGMDMGMIYMSQQPPMDGTRTMNIKLPRTSIIMIPTIYAYHRIYFRHVRWQNYHVHMLDRAVIGWTKLMKWCCVQCLTISMKMNVKTPWADQGKVSGSMPMQMVVMRLRNSEVGM